MAKRYDEVPVKDWNTTHFRQYMEDLHEDVLGVSYYPTGGIAADAGMLGSLIGTRKKPAKYEKELVREFIERCIRTYRPRAGFPGISLAFMLSFRKNILQELELEYQRKKLEVATEDDDYSEMEEWL